MENIKQKTDAWRMERLGKFTSSEIWKLLQNGKSKDSVFSKTGLTYIKDKASEILTGEYTDFSNQATEWGNEYESYAKKWFEKIHKTSVTDCGFYAYNEYFGGSPDGLVDGGIIEIKCPFKTSNFIDLSLICREGVEAFKSEYPEYYYQIQSNMIVTNTDFCIFIIFDPRIDNNSALQVFTFDKNEKDCDRILASIEIAKVELNKIIDIFK